MARDCPNCSTQMVSHEFHHVTVETCEKCALIWFDVEDLMLLLRGDPKAIVELAADLQESGENAPACLEPICPDCAVRLDLTHYMYDSPIEMHVCPKCEGFFTKISNLVRMQMWLDQGHVESDIRHAGFPVVLE